MSKVSEAGKIGGADKHKRTFAGELRLYMRGVGVIWEINKKIIVYKILDTVFSVAQGYVLLYASSLVLNGLFAGDGFLPLVTKAAVCITISLVMNLLQMLFEYIQSCEDETLYSDLGLYLNTLRMTKMYEYTENPEIERLFARAKDSLMDMAWEYSAIFYRVINLVTALTVSFGFFFVKMPPSDSALARAVGSPLAVAALLAVISASIAVNFKVTKRTNQRDYDFERSQDDIYRLVNYYNTGSTGDFGMDMRIFGLGRIISEEQHKTNIRTKYYREKIRINRPSQITSNLTDFATSAFLYLFVALKVYYGALGVGDFVLYAGALVNLAAAIKSMVDWVNDVYRVNRELADAFEYIDLPNTMRSGARKTEGGGVVEFRDVRFKYPGAEVYALDGVSLKFKVGERLAVVGENGSGKTTFIKLLCRLYDPESGEILLDGVNIKEYDYDEYMKLFAVVFQDFSLFSLSVGANISSAGETDAAYDRDKVILCADKAGIGLDGDSHLTPETLLYTYYGKGVQPSGGESQKIALARALYKGSPYIVLDEPTASLDPVAEAEIYSKFDGIAGDGTAVYISHRLSSCRFCDDIAVFDGGKIVQRGTHEALLADSDGKYRELWNAQAQYYTESGDKEAES